MNYEDCTEEELRRLRKRKTCMDLNSASRMLRWIADRNNGLSDDELERLSEARLIIDGLAN